MTVDAATPTSTYQISGVGPYDVPWPYEGGDVVVWAFLGNAQLQLSEGIHWTLTPDAGSSGTITLSPDTAETWDGGTLSIQRDSVAEQGWAGTTSRERGLEASLDRLTRLAQELKALSETALRLVGNSRLPPINTPEAGRTILFDGEAFVPGPAIDQIEAAAEAARYINSAIVGAAITGTVAAVDTPVALPVAGAAVQQVYVGNARQWPPDDWEQVGDTILFKRDYHVGQTYHLTYLVPSEGQTAFATRIALQAARPTMTLPVGTTVTAEGLTYRVEAITFNKIPDMPGLSAVDPTVFHYGAVGGGIIDDTQAFTRAAAAHLFCRVPAMTGGYKVNDTVVNNQCTFIFEGAFYSTQIVGTATKWQLKAISVSNGLIAGERILLEPIKNTLTGSNEQSLRPLRIYGEEPNLASTDYGEGNLPWCEIDLKWKGARTGSGPDGGTNAAKVRTLRVGLTVGGANYDLQSACALSGALLHTEDDTSLGDKVGIAGGVLMAATSPGKVYGGATSVEALAGSSSPQAIAFEADLNLDAAAVIDRVIGINSWNGGAGGGATVHAAYGVGRSGAASAISWKTAFLLYTNGGGTPQPVASDGQIFSADSPMTVADVMEYPDLTVTGNIFNFPNFKVTGAGRVEPAGDVVFAEGKGLDFSASADSAEAGVTITSQRLLDYEEGTWTPVLGNDSGNVTSSYTVQFGRFTRIGRMVHAMCRVKITSLESVTGTSGMRIFGLPYACVSNSQAAATVGIASGLAIAANQVVAAYVEDGQKYIRLRLWDAATGQTGLLASEFSATGEISLNVSYSV